MEKEEQGPAAAAMKTSLLEDDECIMPRISEAS